MDYNNLMGNKIEAWTYETFVQDISYNLLQSEALEITTNILWADLTNTIRFPLGNSLRREVYMELIENNE